MTTPLPDLPDSSTEPTTPIAPMEPTAPGEPPTEPTEPTTSFTRRHRGKLIIAGVAVVAVGAGTGIALAASGGSPGVAAAPASASPLVPPSASPSARARTGKATRATVVSESGSTWIVRTQSGQTVTVMITPRTKFGTRKLPATRAAFTAGAPVLVLGQEANGAITATRVAGPVGRVPSAHPSSTPARPSPPATA